MNTLSQGGESLALANTLVSDSKVSCTPADFSVEQYVELEAMGLASPFCLSPRQERLVSVAVSSICHLDDVVGQCSVPPPPTTMYKLPSLVIDSLGVTVTEQSELIYGDYIDLVLYSWTIKRGGSGLKRIFCYDKELFTSKLYTPEDRRTIAKINQEHRDHARQ